jgi:hypothetical protein
MLSNAEQFRAVRSGRLGKENPLSGRLFVIFVQQRAAFGANPGAASVFDHKIKDGE